MNKKRLDNLSDLRRQRERMRRIAVGAMLAAGAFSLGSCEGLTSRDASLMPQVGSSQTTPQVASGPVGAIAARYPR